MSIRQSQNDADGPKPIKLEITPRLYLLPATAFVVGSIIGLVREGRKTALQFLAENVHRPPTTVQGWYFYNKTKNYKVVLGGLRGAGREGIRLATMGLGWVAMEEGLETGGWGEVKEIGAGIGMAGLFSALYRLPWKGTRQSMVIGIMMGGALKGLGMGRGRLEEWRKDRPPIE